MIFLEKIFLMSYSINWPNFIVSLALLLQILSNMYIVIICFPVYDIINFEINLISYISHKIISDALIWFFIGLLGNCCILHPWNILKTFKRLFFTRVMQGSFGSTFSLWLPVEFYQEKYCTPQIKTLAWTISCFIAND